ncbi:hypothetical protein [Gemmatimonas sp.]|jgi:futalosine hydrolase|uniref:phosphorylase family protein n=1 Tax=Gemmatimonas sp. TaxID=1962908 RepID=UPI0037C14A5B
MPLAPRILVIAATSRELAAPDALSASTAPFIGVLCGVGPVEAAIASTRAIQEHHPDGIVHVGIAGARRAAALAPGSLVIGSASHYSDLSALPAEWAPSRLTSDPSLLEAFSRDVPRARVLPIGTSARVGGTLSDATRCDVEAMEGFSVLRAAQRAGVPAIEVRAISNDIEEDDRARWHFATAFDAITTVTPTLVATMQEFLRRA